MPISKPLAAGSVKPSHLSGNQAGNAPAFACRAWGEFNGAGTLAVNASGNVTSVTDNGAGNYAVLFAEEMQDDKYAVVLMSAGARTQTTGNIVSNFGSQVINKTAAGFTLLTQSFAYTGGNNTVAQSDHAYIAFEVLR